jgi:hypothetical protein
MTSLLITGTVIQEKERDKVKEVYITNEEIHLEF